MWMGVSKRKPNTPKLLADIPLNKSFLKKITFYINFRFVTGVNKKFFKIVKEVQKTCPSLPQQVQV